MRRSTVLFIALWIAPFAALSQNHIDFSGSWKMDAARSETAHQAAPIGPVMLLISQNEAELSIETKTGVKDRSAIANEKLVFKLDGSESTMPDNSGNPVISKAHWEGNNLVTETGRNMRGSTITTRYTLTLAADGKELKIHKTLTVQHGYQDPGANNTGTANDIFIKAPASSRK